ncbi:HTH_Tnp_Tc3_2 domain-containing protein [Trichonephila clavipes]|nr:HTH_Tnp_Tc3_2 domain-containing protein [Trichonephila clavipes]
MFNVVQEKPSFLDHGTKQTSFGRLQPGMRFGHMTSTKPTYPAICFIGRQAQVAPSLGAFASSRTIRMCLAEGHLGSRRPLRVLPLTFTHRRIRLEWRRARGNWIAAERNQVVFSDARIQIQSHQ